MLAMFCMQGAKRKLSDLRKYNRKAVKKFFPRVEKSQRLHWRFQSSPREKYANLLLDVKWKGNKYPSNPPLAPSLLTLTSCVQLYMSTSFQALFLHDHFLIIETSIALIMSFYSQPLRLNYKSNATGDIRHTSLYSRSYPQGQWWYLKSYHFLVL